MLHKSYDYVAFVTYVAFSMIRFFLFKSVSDIASDSFNNVLTSLMWFLFRAKMAFFVKPNVRVPIVEAPLSTPPSEDYSSSVV